MGLGDFQRRSNKEERYRHRDEHPGNLSFSAGTGKSWEDAPTPRSERGMSMVGDGSVRVPNRGWDETPQGGRSEGILGKRGRGEGDQSIDIPLPSRHTHTLAFN